MVLIHFIEDRTIVLSQLAKNIPSVNDNIKIKGRKGKVSSVKQIKENEIHVEVIFEKVVVKNQPILKDTKKKK